MMRVGLRKLRGVMAKVIQCQWDAHLANTPRGSCIQFRGESSQELQAGRALGTGEAWLYRQGSLRSYSLFLMLLRALLFSCIIGKQLLEMSQCSRESDRGLEQEKLSSLCPGQAFF